MKNPTPKTKPASAQPRLRGKPKRLDPRALRRSLDLNQSDFWHALGVSPSGGSRYERGQKMPPPTMMLFDLVYVQKINLERIEACDISILYYLRVDQPDLYAKLAKVLGIKPVAAKKYRSKK